MKILFISQYITSTCHPAFMRNQTGFGYMVLDIAQHVAQIEDVDIYVLMAFTPQLQVNGLKVIGHSKWDLLASFRFRNWFDGIAFNRKYKQPFKSRIRTLYIFGAISQIEADLKRYDIVHIHGCSEMTEAVIRACKRQNLPFLVTLHGLNSFEPAVNLNEAMCMYERDFLRSAADNHYHVSFISTGNRISAEEYIGRKVDSFHVVCNGCDITSKPMLVDVRKKYGISDDDFVFAFIGNVSVNKNQVQVARAWHLIPDSLRQRCKVLFVGRNTEKDDLVQYIRINHLESNLILCGMQSKESISDYYHACDSTILTSITEGFGLSIIEGFVYGKPNVTFLDLPASSDLYDEKAMVFASERSDEALASAMVRVMQSSFDQDYIRKYAMKFSLTGMAKKYCKIYNDIL